MPRDYITSLHALKRNMALPSSCRLFSQTACSHVLRQGRRRCWLPGLSPCRTHTMYRGISLISPVGHSQGRTSFRLCTSARRADERSGTTRATRSRCVALWSAVAFSLFGSMDKRTEEQKTEDEIVLLLRKAKYNMMLGELDAANSFLHKALGLAHQSQNKDAILYAYSLMANLAFVQGQLDNAEKLFKAAMSFMLSGGTPEDDNAIIEMSLKLASIYASQNKNELAEHGFQFCTESLEAKIEKHQALPAYAVSEDERKNTRLLLGLSLDTRARYLTAARRFTAACRDYHRALIICQEEQGEAHPQTLVLMSDLATVLDLQGKHEEALAHVHRAVTLSQVAGHPDQHVLLGNMAGILMHKGAFEEALKLYEEALALARAAGDEEAVQQLEEGLQELDRRCREERRSSSRDPPTEH
ncbi:tetratricopeptide repeat protein 19, mitochondrial isoform X1 [Electrophorus electricus]|nr:tetratricopeptide repeat protein 19, mitochondrial isoform X1 [Electrophorus electricus]